MLQRSKEVITIRWVAETSRKLPDPCIWICMISLLFLPALGEGPVTRLLADLDQ